MFIDSSALVALLAREPEAQRIAAAIEAAPLRRVIPLVLLESAMVLASRLNIEPAIAEQAIAAVIEEAAIIVVPETRETAQAALAAFTRYGKGRGQKAQLNLADCMVYASARLADAPLLFIGDDLARTDVVSALQRRARR